MKGRAVLTRCSRTSGAAAEARRRRVAASRDLAAARAAAEEHDHDHDHEGHDHDHDHEGHDHGHDHDDAAAAVEGPYGAGSAAVPEDGSIPEGFEIKGNADSMLYHVPGSRYYNATKAEAYFATAEDAERAGFSAPGAGADSEEEG